MTRSSRAPSDQRGFTMVELLAATAILGLVMAGLLGMLTASRNAYSRGTNTVSAQQNARVALDRMAKEIREAGYHPRPPDTMPATCASPPCWTFDPIINLSATSFTLQFDWNADGAISTSGKVVDASCVPVTTPCRGERVTYALSGTNLTRQEVGVDGTAQTIATGITALQFKYYRVPDTTVGTYNSAVETSTPSQVRVVGISVTAKPGTDGASATMTDMIRLRIR
jgi:prepilin-type N-terminal cleavage/methylation domain-containing protein